MRRFVAALLAVLLSCLLTAVPAAATPVHTAAATATATNAGVEYGGAGYNLVAPWMKGSPYAQHIWLNPHTYGAGHLALLLPALGRELKSWGFAISYVGYSVAEPAVNGRITVSSDATYCAAHPSYLGYTIPYYSHYANGDAFMVHADVKICTRAFAYGWATLQTVLYHETGHAMGLGHYNYPYDGYYQIMNASISSATNYRNGDRNGMCYLAVWSSRLRAGWT